MIDEKALLVIILYENLSIWTKRCSFEISTSLTHNVIKIVRVDFQVADLSGLLSAGKFQKDAPRN